MWFSQLLTSVGGDIAGATLYQMLQKYILTEQQLVENGFPQPSPDKSGSAVVQLQQAKSSKLRGQQPCFAVKRLDPSQVENQYPDRYQYNMNRPRIGHQ